MVDLLINITTKSGFIKNLLPGDIVLPDRGFNIDELIATVGPSIQIHAFIKGRRQLSGKEVDSTRSIANVIIHVERVIGAVRQKYTMLESTIPIKLVMKREGKEHPALDKIVLVACALTNIGQFLKGSKHGSIKYFNRGKLIDYFTIVLSP